MRDRSNSAMPPKTVIIIFPAGVVVSAQGSSRDCILAFFQNFDNLRSGDTLAFACTGGLGLNAGGKNGPTTLEPNPRCV